jgi:RNA polymerase sigma-70 factor (ECF subfamily)
LTLLADHISAVPANHDRKSGSDRIDWVCGGTAPEVERATFTPTTTGTQSATISIASDDLPQRPQPLLPGAAQPRRSGTLGNHRKHHGGRCRNGDLNRCQPAARQRVLSVGAAVRQLLHFHHLSLNKSKQNMSGPDQHRVKASRFPNTSWSLIRQSQDIANPAAMSALNQLARAYWRPLYACVRSVGYTHQGAEDAVQRMFEQLLSRDSLRAVLPGETRFRSFLITCLENSMASEHRARTRQKRGGGVEVDPLEQGELAELGEQMAHLPEATIDREWAREIFGRALAQLEEDMVQRGRQAVFDAVLPVLRGEQPEGGYAGLAARLGVTEGGARKTVFDLRARLGVMLRRVVTATVADPAEVDDELRYLLSLL